jgi:zinc/manganese transport system substrate-binding protein
MFEELVKEIGGDKVDVKHVASPKFNIHFIQPKPSDVRNVAKADLFVFTGLDLEAWVDPLLEAAGKPSLFRGGEHSVDLSTGIRLLKEPTGVLSRSMGDLHLFGNPHYAMSPESIKIAASTLLGKLKAVDPTNAAYYVDREKDFISRLDAKIDEWKGLCAHCAGKEVVSYHDDFEYMADFLGIKTEQFIEPKPGIPPTPKHLEFLESYVKEKGVRAIVMPTYFPKDGAERLAKRVGVKVVTICQNVGEISGTDSIFDLFDYNFKQISEALK